ncbi:MAG: DivIVA domain-containing protein [Roseofilum sp. SBFL]|uniref:hypothetical protein n=1 Tax=unclassified Roseofilum TaxID=2620099 RepID=UPI001B116B29|nr:MULTISPECIES: hypothetical protein [unclassified Roseofilum]MBP0015086.1 DivIVA domain-containing protein [Roseofilum sp. SID3]MBP0024290.1 DivIVA domain-containing protein [Roseofilum sp. SID2]MBP0036527.1 DivIVA domain-containing protein [Roseofilum sp. SID1]MBP0041540.1 DivIVA domain-containing protein [Roseofilum sp. SBFL]
MLQQDPSPINSEREPHEPPQAESSANGTSGLNTKPEVDIQEELERLKEMILMSTGIPWTHYTFVDEDQLLDQIELIQFHLPKVFEQAVTLVSNRDEIMLKAKRYSQDLISTAEQQASEILDEMSLVQQAEQEAQAIWQQTLQECQKTKENLVLELQELEKQSTQDLELQRQKLLEECEMIQKGADDYADQVLQDLESRLGEMLRVVRNGREQLQ